jgi:hypothetical protein
MAGDLSLNYMCEETSWLILQVARLPYRVKPGYNDIGLCDTPDIVSDLTRYQ